MMSIAPDRAWSIGKRNDLVGMSSKGRQVIEWWQRFMRVAEQANSAVEPESAAEPPSGKTITNADKVLRALRDKPSGVYVGTIAESANLTRGAVDAALNGLMRDGAVLCAAGGVYRLNAARVA